MAAVLVAHAAVTAGVASLVVRLFAAPALVATYQALPWPFSLVVPRRRNPGPQGRSRRSSRPRCRSSSGPVSVHRFRPGRRQSFLVFVVEASFPAEKKLASSARLGTRRLIQSTGLRASPPKLRFSDRNRPAGRTSGLCSAPNPKLYTRGFRARRLSVSRRRLASSAVTRALALK